MIRRIGLMLFLAGIGGIIMGIYSFCIELPSREKPSVVTVSELERDTPWNRHVVISNAVLSIEDGVHYTERSGGLMLHESYYLPVRDSALAGLHSIPPRVFAKISTNQLNELRSERTDKDFVIEGMRLTRWDIESKVKDCLATNLGADTANNLIVVELGKKPEGVGDPLQRVGGGIAALIIGIFISAGGRQSRVLSR